LRDAAGVASEVVESGAPDLRGLYAELQTRHGFRWSTETLRVAAQGEFAKWGDALQDGSEVAFIPPVSGG
jgi:molybdopterin synthase sulfur carrier subunit